MSVLKKKPRSLSLTPEIEDKLLKLCDRLGVNPHAYLLNEVGKAVNRDYLAYQIAEGQQNMFQDFMDKMAGVVEARSQNNSHSDCKDEPPRAATFGGSE